MARLLATVFLIVIAIMVIVLLGWMVLDGSDDERREFSRHEVRHLTKLRSTNSCIGCDFTAVVYATGQKMDDQSLGAVNLTSANLSGLMLRQTNLFGATLVMTDLSNSNLANASLGKANLTKADLTGVNLSGAGLRGTNLTGANLTNASLNSAVDISGAILCNTTMPDGSINNSDCPSDFTAQTPDSLAEMYCDRGVVMWPNHCAVNLRRYTKYVGECQCGKRHGQGTTTWGGWFIFGTRYKQVGEWKNDKLWEGTHYVDGNVRATYSEGVRQEK